MYLPPCIRNSDEITSKLADRYITESGQRMSWVRLIEAIVADNPNCTSRELALISGISNEVLHKRLPDSNNLEKGAARKCSVTGRMAVTWHER